MEKKSTEELEKILTSTHVTNFQQYLKENDDSMQDSDRPFTFYMREIFRQKKLRQQDVFLAADIPERYGYKLIAGEKITRKRDVILRICYAANMTIEETQQALKWYSMPLLYARIPRDALLMVAFNERPGTLHEVNDFLMENGMEPFVTVGEQEVN